VIILDVLIHKGKVAHYACVSQEWKAAIEQHHFRSLRLRTSDIPVLETLTTESVGLIKYIYYCIELDEYGCYACELPNINDAKEAERGILKDGIRSLFCVLSKLPIQGKLTLDISVYSLSNTQHFFKYIRFEHADVHGSRSISHQTPQQHASTHDSIHRLPRLSHFFPVYRIFHGLRLCDSDETFWAAVPQDPSVTHLLLRRQTRRRWLPETLVKLIERLPNLQEMCYEPRREWIREGQLFTDLGKCSINRVKAPLLICLVNSVGEIFHVTSIAPLEEVNNLRRSTRDVHLEPYQRFASRY
jgi:hypothetical protein